MERFYIDCIRLYLCFQTERFSLIVDMSVLTMLVFYKVGCIELHAWAATQYAHLDTGLFGPCTGNLTDTGFVIIIGHIVVIIATCNL